MPASISFLNNPLIDINQRLDKFFELKKEAKLEYPFLVKSEKGNKAEMAHTFYSVNDVEDLKRALNEHGFMNDTLLC